MAHIPFLLKQAVGSVIEECNRNGQRCSECSCKDACDALPITTRPKHVEKFWHEFSKWQRRMEFEE